MCTVSCRSKKQQRKLAVVQPRWKQSLVVLREKVLTLDQTRNVLRNSSFLSRLQRKVASEGQKRVCGRLQRPGIGCRVCLMWQLWSHKLPVRLEPISCLSVLLSGPEQDPPPPPNPGSHSSRCQVTENVLFSGTLHVNVPVVDVPACGFNRWTVFRSRAASQLFHLELIKCVFLPQIHAHSSQLQQWQKHVYAQIYKHANYFFVVLFIYLLLFLMFCKLRCAYFTLF